MKKTWIIKKQKIKAKYRVLLLSFCFIILTVSALEALLRIRGFRWDPWDLKKEIFVPSSVNGFMENEKQYINSSYYSYPLAKNQTFQRKKAEGVLRIILIGSSCIYGFDTNILKSMLCEDINREKLVGVEIINMGFQSCGSDRAVFTVKEAINYEPDIIFIYSGHSEFVSASNHKNFFIPSTKYNVLLIALKSRLIQLMVSSSSSLPTKRYMLPQLFNIRRFYSLEEKKEVYENYYGNLSEMIKLAKSIKSNVIIGTLAFNRLEFRPSFIKCEEKNFLEKYFTFDRADDALRKAGLFYHKNGDFKKAKYFFDKFNETTDNQMNASNITNDIVRKVADENDILLLDLEKIFDEISPYGYPGNEFFIDHCHFNREGYDLLAQSFHLFIKEAIPEFFLSESTLLPDQ